LKSSLLGSLVKLYPRWKNDEVGLLGGVQVREDRSFSVSLLLTRKL